MPAEKIEGWVERFGNGVRVALRKTKVSYLPKWWLDEAAAKKEAEKMVFWEYCGRFEICWIECVKPEGSCDGKVCDEQG